MPMRGKLRTDKPACHILERPPAAPKLELLTRGEFEIISWLAAIGTVMAAGMTVACTAFEPAAALLGQFP